MQKCSKLHVPAIGLCRSQDHSGSGRTTSEPLHQHSLLEKKWGSTALKFSLRPSCKADLAIATPSAAESIAKVAARS